MFLNVTLAWNVFEQNGKIMSGKYSDEAIRGNARKKILEMLHRRSFAERWEPVQKEMHWVLCGRNNPAHRQKILPEYCYGIFDFFRHTICKALFSAADEMIPGADKERLAACKPPNEAGEHLEIIWERVGSVVGAGERGLRFFELEAGPLLEREGLSNLKPEQATELAGLLAGDQWAEKRAAEMQALEPDRPLAEIFGKHLNNFVGQIKGVAPAWSRMAYESGAEAMEQLHRGISKGAGGFLDAKGDFTGATKLADTYQFLLLAWPEIQEMQNARPPKTRKDLWEWLEPFSHAGWIEITDLDQLNRLCGPIKLKFKTSGRPFKAK